MKKTEEKPRGNEVKKWLVAIAIALVFNLFVNYGINTFYPGPERSDFCEQDGRFAYPKPAGEPYKCETVNATEDLKRNCPTEKGYIAYRNYDSNHCATEAYCETCDKEFQEVEKRHSGNVFVVLIILSIAVLVAGITLKVEAVSLGFSMAGVLGLFISSMRYWSHLQDVYRFILLGVVLAILIWVGYKKIGTQGKG